MKLLNSTFSKLVSLIFVITIFANLNISAQAVRIGAGSGTPDASAILDIVSTTSGILIPRMTESQRTNAAFDLTGSPEGVLVYQTDGAVPGFYFYNGTDWQLAVGKAGPLWTRDVANSFTYLTNGTDNVGIGLVNPNYPLTVTSATEDVTGAFFNTETSQDNYGVYGDCSQTDYYGFGGVFVGGYIGAYGSVTATGSNTYFGLRGVASGGTGTTIGVAGTAEGASTTSFTGVGAGGLFNANSFGSISRGHGATIGVGVWGIGYNGAYSYWNGAGGSFSGYGTGLYATASDALNGNGIVAAANGEAAVTYGGGSGGSFTGTVTGVNGIAKGTSDLDAGGYFKCENGTWVYVGTSYGGTMYDTYGNGTNAKSVKSLGKGYVGMFTPISPEILLQDYGSGKLVNGKAHIDIDPVLTKNIFVNKKHPLRVFIQLEGDCKGVYVTNKTAKGFDVVELQGGMSNINFSWTITANRADRYSDDGKTLESKHVDVRFPAGLSPQKTVNVEKGKNSKINTLVLKTDKPEVVKFGKKGEINSKKLNTDIIK